MQQNSQAKAYMQGTLKSNLNLYSMFIEGNYEDY